jgi:hypothetical protein
LLEPAASAVLTFEVNPLLMSGPLIRVPATRPARIEEVVVIIAAIAVVTVLVGWCSVTVLRRWSRSRD